MLVFAGSVLAFLAAAFGLDPVTDALINYYSKEAIELRKPLDDFDVRALPSIVSDPVLCVISMVEETVPFFVERGNVSHPWPFVLQCSP